MQKQKRETGGIKNSLIRFKQAVWQSFSFSY
jgi:hypothetical protein